MLVSHPTPYSGIGKDSFTGSGLVSGCSVPAGEVDKVAPSGVPEVESMFTVNGLQ